MHMTDFNEMVVGKLLIQFTASPPNSGLADAVLSLPIVIQRVSILPFHTAVLQSLTEEAITASNVRLFHSQMEKGKEMIASDIEAL